MKKKRGPVRKWFTAFILSPGMIFTQAYVLVWLGTNLWLEYAFKQHLKQIFVSESGQRYQLDVHSLETGPGLNSITLKKLSLLPLGFPENRQPGKPTRQIAELRIECPELSLLPFSPNDQAISLRKVSRRIISHTAQ
ncbi:MAG: hypothetical protein JW764_00350 [Chlorobiaceae bacterium]|nr:hypothetical protein [Chlorobiaceae bacterium]